MVPNLNRPEWESMVKGTYTPKLTSLSLQLKLNALQLDLKLNKLDAKSAATQLHDFCEANENLVQKDLPVIFK